VIKLKIILLQKKSEPNILTYGSPFCVIIYTSYKRSFF